MKVQVKVRIVPIVGIAVSLLLAACGGSASEGTGTQSAPVDTVPGVFHDVFPDEVRVRARVDYSSDGPPIAVEAGALEPAAKGWADHQIELRGAQIEWEVTAELAGLEYRAADGFLTASEMRDDSLVVLGYQDTVGFRIVVPAPLMPGSHVYELDIPVWLDPVSDPPTQPDDVVSVRLQYDVQAPDVRTQVAGFCDVAVPLMNGRTPTLSELDRIIDVAASELEPPGQAAITMQAEALAASLDPESSSSNAYSTRDLNIAIEELCNVTMFSISSVE